MRTSFVLAAALTSSLLLCSATRAQQQSPELSLSVVDLRTPAGLTEVAGKWSFTEARPVQSTFQDANGTARTSLDIAPRIGTPEFDSASWQAIGADELEVRRTSGKFSFGWYRLELTVPPTIQGLTTQGRDLVLETVVDDYAEVWVNGTLSTVLGEHSGVVNGWNAPSRNIIGRGVTPGDKINVAIFASNAPLSSPPSNFVWIRSATLELHEPGHAMTVRPVPVETTLNRADPEFDVVFSPGTKAERLATGFSFTEGPIWIPALTDGKSYGGGGTGGYLLFSDPNKNVIHRWNPLDGTTSIFRVKSGYSGINGAPIGEYHQPGSNGLTLDETGRLVIAEHGNRRVSRLEPRGDVTVLSDSFEGKRLNSPNDVVVRSDGAVFFTDPPFGLPKVYGDPRKELAFSGIMGIFNGATRMLSAELKGPNGLAFSPDERRLYVSNWDESRKVILRFDVGADGTLSNQTTFADLTSVGAELCLDGLKVDQAGRVYVSAPDGIRVYRADGAHLGTLQLPELAANFAFGDADLRTLYITARTGLYRIRVATPGKK